MKKKINIKKAIDKLAEEWLGKKGVVAISDEEEEGELHIVFFVDSKNIKNEDYPQDVKGYKVIVKPSGRIISHGS